MPFSLSLGGTGFHRGVGLGGDAKYDGYGMNHEWYFEVVTGGRL